MAVAVIVLWVFLVRFLFEMAGSMPAPAVFMLPIFYFSLASWAVWAAVRDEPVYLLIAGGLSLLPIGLYLLFMPGFARWIGILDLGIIAVAIVLLRTGEDPTEQPASQNRSPRSTRTSLV
jgi:hypothetical protein